MKLIKTVAYVRCSHEEQKKHGFTVEAQKKGLQKYANEKGYIIVDWYIDEAKSARKKSNTRKELMRLVEDAKQKKFEMIIFKCIDRWFRNIGEYYKIQEVLEDNKIDWECSEEDYDTTTREGRLKLNLYLMLAQDEADRGSERINYIFENKIRNGEAITGSVPFGFKVETIDNVKRVVVDESKRVIVNDIFDTFELLQSKRQTLATINNKYDIYLPYRSLTKLLRNTYYYGAYRFNENYIYGGSYISKERWEGIQEILKKNIKATPNKHIYLFTGLIRCPECNSVLSGNHIVNGRKKIYYYYRCNKHKLKNNCNNNLCLSEKKLEEKLISSIKTQLTDYIASFSVKTKEKKKPKIDVNKIKKELERLNTLYLKARIEEEEYEERYNELNAKLKVDTKKEKKRDLSYLADLLNSDFETIYNKLTKVEKRTLLRSFIREIEADPTTLEHKIAFK